MSGKHEGYEPHTAEADSGEADGLLEMLRDTIKAWYAAGEGDSADAEHEAALVIVELFESLDRHLSNGEAPPRAWRTATTVPATTPSAT